MQLLRKLLIGGLAAIGLVACFAGTMLAARYYRHVSLREAREIHAADWENLGAAFDGGYHLPAENWPGIAHVADDGDDHNDEAAEARVMAVIEEELRDAGQEEREVWRDELKGHAPDAIREILALRRRMSAGSPVSMTANVALTAADAPELLPLPESSTSPASRLSADALGLIESAIEATRAAEQVILNNIANANTVAFKRSRALFGDMPYRHVAIAGPLDQQGKPASAGIALGAGVKLLATQVDVSEGRLRHVKGQLDLAIQGEGYFQIKDGNRFLYTRAGSFTVNGNGEIVLVSKDRGRLLEPAITIPQDTVEITISSEGIVSVLQVGQETQLNQIGQIQLARFISPSSLLARGDNLFKQTTASGHPMISTPGQDGLGEPQQGYLEESNVVVEDELAELRRMQEQLKTLRQLHAEFSGSSRTP